MRSAVTSFTLGLIAMLLLGAPRRGDAWTFRYDDPNYEGDAVHALRVGPGGELYVAGDLDDVAALFKLDPATGETLWRYDFGAEPDLMYDTLRGLTTDADGGVFAAGSLNFNFDAVRVDPVTGQEVWHTILSGPVGTSYDYARALAVDGFGGVVVAGGIQEHDTPFGPDFAAVRLDAATGAVLWKTTIDGGASTTALYRGEWAEDVAIAPNGDAIAVGSLTVPLPGQSTDDRVMAATRFARDDGHEVWRWTYSSGKNSFLFDIARHVVVDASGDVIVCGGATSESAALFKLDGMTGTELWRLVDANERTNGVAVDAAGDVLVAAATNHAAFPFPSVYPELTVLKLGGTTGAELWRMQIPGPGEAYQVAVDAAQDVIAVGGNRAMISAVKVAGSDGHVVWNRQHHPAPGVHGGWGSVVLDASGHVFVGGTTAGPPDSAPPDLSVTALDELTGAGVGCGNGVLDLGETCDDGNAADFDGCDGLCTVEHCGDGVVDPNEQCDDGGHAAGDGCDAQCNFEGCGDGEVGPGENCDDGNRTPGDTCSATCQIEICETANVAPAARLKLRKLGGIPGDERMLLQMTVTSDNGTPLRFQLTVEDLGAGGAPLLDLSYRTNLLGGIMPSPGCDPQTDLRLAGRGGDTYLNRTNALPPTCAPGSASGFRKMTVKPVHAVPGQYVIKATFQHASLPTPLGPLRATVVVGEVVDWQEHGTCWQSAFTPSQCTAVGSTAFDCK